MLQLTRITSGIPSYSKYNCTLENICFEVTFQLLNAYLGNKCMLIVKDKYKNSWIN